MSFIRRGFGVRNRLAVLLSTLMLLLFSVPVNARNYTYESGYVLYHQSFDSDVNLGSCDISLGSVGSQTVDMYITDDGLKIDTEDSERAYILLPDISTSGSRTIEFSFRFDSKESDNARLAFILTCRGSEPTNVTSVVFRAGGTIDDFSDPIDEIKDAISNGETINVKIPLESGILHEVILESGDSACIVENREVKLIEGGNHGFVLRNADVTIDDVYIVNGVDYDEKSGYYSVISYSDDYTQTLPDAELDAELSGGCGGDSASAEVCTSPETGDGSVALLLLNCFACVIFACCAVITGKRNRRRIH